MKVEEISKALKQNLNIVTSDIWTLEHAGLLPRTDNNEDFDQVQTTIDEFERLLFRCELSNKEAAKRLSLSKNTAKQYYIVILLRRLAVDEDFYSMRFLEDLLSPDNISFREGQLQNLEQIKRDNEDYPGISEVILPADMYRRYKSIRNFKEKFHGSIPFAVFKDDDLRHAWGIED